MADIESPLIFETAASNTAPSPDGLPPNSSPNIVYTQGREALAMAKRAWNRLGPTVTSGGSANLQTLSYTSNPTALVRGQGYCFIAGATNTGPATLTVGALAAAPILIDGFPLQGGEIRAGLIVELFTDGTSFHLTSGRPLVSMASALGGSMRNFLFNPLFNVQQRGTQGTYGVSFSANQSPYIVDRWYLRIGANNATSVAAAALFGNPLGSYVLQINRNPGATGTVSYILGQTFDTDVIQVLAGQQVTVSVQVQAAANFSGGAVSLAFYAGTGAPTRLISGFTGVTTPINVNGTPTPGGGVITISGTGAIPANARQLEWELTWAPSGTAGAADTLSVYAPRLNLGPVDLGPDLTRIYTTELPICQRFYAKSFIATRAPAQATGDYNGAVLTMLSTGASGLFGNMAYFPATMRAIPSNFLTYNPITADANWRDSTNSVARTVSVSTISDSNAGIQGTGGVAGTTNSIHWTADAEIM